MLSRSVILKTSSWPIVERFVRHSRLFRPLVGRFIAGDLVEEALTASGVLLDKGLRVTLDYLGENTSTEQEAIQAKETYSKMLDEISKFEKSKQVVGAAKTLKLQSDVIPIQLAPSEQLNISIKLTQCGLDQGRDFCENNLREVLWRAEEHDNFVRVDMESSAYTQATIDMVGRVWADFKNTGVVLQSYLFRNDEDVDWVIERKMRCRLVKGAYLEPSTVAYKEKSKVDEAYVRQAKKLLKFGFYPAIATQDEAIIEELCKYVEAEKIDPSRFEWQMLYGIRRDLQDGLKAKGFNVRIYVPFGDSWYPYFTRRLAERPANMFFIMKAALRK